MTKAAVGLPKRPFSARVRVGARSEVRLLGLKLEREADLFDDEDGAHAIV